MTSIQERLQRKREPLDKWSIREQLCLSFAVAKVGDQNWMSVSRSLKPFGEGRPGDWFHQKNCAAQYGALLENIDIPKRKKRSSGVETLESPAELILKRLIQERLLEMKKDMDKQKTEYKKLQEEMTLLKSGAVSEEQLDLMCKQIEEEEQQKENEALVHAQWLKEREIRKAEIERVWRPTIKIPPNMIQTGQKRKASDALDQSHDNDSDAKLTPDAPAKPALSPLLTSLLKSPSHSQNVITTSSILHSAITSNQRPATATSSPTIASLLNSSASVQVSPGIQHLVSTAIAQEPTQTLAPKDPIADLLENADANLVDDIENSILSVGDGDLPEIKNEEVDVIISDLIENADIDPETDLLDGDDIISNLESELEELDNKEKAELEKEKEEEKRKEMEMEREREREKEIEKEKAIEKEKQKQEVLPKGQSAEIKSVAKEVEIDPFEFQEEPEYDVKLSNRSATNSVQTISTILSPPDVNADSPAVESSAESEELVVEQDQSEDSSVSTPADEIKTEKEDADVTDPSSKVESDECRVEIVEVLPGDAVIGNDLDKTQIQDIVHSNSSNPIKPDIKEEEEEVQDEPDPKPSTPVTVDDSAKNPISEEVKTEKEETVAVAATFSPPEYREDIYDDNIELTKIDKTKAKRDYSRTKKKDESDFDILLAVEQAVNSTIEEEEVDSSSEQEQEPPKKLEVAVASTKTEIEHSNSPWTEEEPEQEPEQEQEQEPEPEPEQEQEVEQDILRPNTRRYSTPATPIDSVPNSPASSYFEDDRDYRSWKKSLMLVYSRLSNHKYASLFHRPITNEQAPGYHKLVKRPMDLSTIKKNIESGAIRTTSEFKRDILLMFNNAIMYNKTDDTVYNMTMEIQQEAVEQIKILLHAQTDSAAPARRETRTSEGPGSKRKRDSESLQVQSKSKKRKED